MTPTPDIKKKHLKQIGEITAMLREHGVRGYLSDVGPEMFEFTIQTSKPLTLLVKALYRREGVERVLVNGRGGRGQQYLQICLTSWS